MEHEDLAAVRPAYRLLRGKLADLDRARDELDRARDRLQVLIDGFVGLYPDLAQEEDRDEAPVEAVVESPEVVTEQPTMGEEAPAEAPTPEPVSVSDDSPSADGYIPRGKEAVVTVMSEHPGRWFTAPEVLRAMEQHGWTPRSETPEQALRAVRTALLRAIKADRIQSRRVDGRSLAYRFPPAIEPVEVDLIPSVT
jgi:hypothetical protein